MQRQMIPVEITKQVNQAVNRLNQLIIEAAKNHIPVTLNVCAQKVNQGTECNLLKVENPQ